METELLKRITVVPGLMVGWSTIRGMRFNDSEIICNFTSGMTETEFSADFPYLENVDTKAVLLYAAQKQHHPVILTLLNAA